MDTTIFDTNEAYKQAIVSHYKNGMALIVKNILVADDFEDIESTTEALQKILNKKITIKHPKNGNLAKLY